MSREAELAQSKMRAAAYGGVVNHGLLALFRPGIRVLDVGCGTGGWAPALRAKGARQLVGVEFAPAAADQAELVYDRVVREPVEDLSWDQLGGEEFDTIIAADVLEHLVDPWRELGRWTEWLAPGGELVLSVPNLRYFRLLLALVRGRFDYSDAGGLMDRTHLRWFTRASLGDDLAASGWQPRIWGSPDGARSRRLDRALGGRFGDFLVPQLRVVAGRASDRA
jgi:2-polyprenyl-3-methyl-5-hydroxy-6-metoxy-1,4-benzoquinol methylase